MTNNRENTTKIGGTNVNSPSDLVQNSTWGGLLNEFLWMCAGVNRKILLKCPTDWAKYAGQGGLILFTALMAMLSGGYAFWTIFDSVGLAVGFGIFWGLLIFNIDRFMVNTMYSDGKYTISLGEIAAGLPRIIIAIFIGIVISTPIELKIFEDEINVTIEEIKKQKLAGYVKKDEQKLDQLKVKRDNVINTPLEDVIATSTELKNNDLYQRRQQKLQVWNTENTELQSLYSARQKETDSTKYYQLTKKINSKNAELHKTKSEINSLNVQLMAGDKDYKDAYEKAQAKKDTEVDRLTKEIDGLKINIDNAKETYSSITEEEFGGFKTRMSAYSKMKKDDFTTRIVGLFITLLFIIIEVCPTFFKMMIAEGPYDFLLDAERHSKNVASIKIQSDINDQINTEVTLSSEKNKAKVEEELRNNKELLAQISAVQSEILSIAIAKWREEELRKVNENPSQYINGNVQKQN